MFHAAAVVSFQLMLFPTPESHSSSPDATEMTDKKITWNSPQTFRYNSGCRRTRRYVAPQPDPQWLQVWNLEKLYGSLGFLYFISSSFLLWQQQEVTTVSCLFNKDSASFEEESPVLLWRLVSFQKQKIFYIFFLFVSCFYLEFYDFRFFFGCSNYSNQIKTIRKNK